MNIWPILDKIFQPIYYKSHKKIIFNLDKYISTEKASIRLSKSQVFYGLSLITFSKRCMGHICKCKQFFSDSTHSFTNFRWNVKTSPMPNCINAKLGNWWSVDGPNWKRIFLTRMDFLIFQSFRISMIVLNMTFYTTNRPCNVRMLKNSTPMQKIWLI